MNIKNIKNGIIQPTIIDHSILITTVILTDYLLYNQLAEYKIILKI